MDENKVLTLVLRTQISQVIGQSLRVHIRMEDMEVIEPALQRIMRNGLNPSFNFDLKQPVRTE